MSTKISTAMMPQVQSDLEAALKTFRDKYPMLMVDVSVAVNAEDVEPEDVKTFRENGPIVSGYEGDEPISEEALDNISNDLIGADGEPVRLGDIIARVTEQVRAKAADNLVGDILHAQVCPVHGEAVKESWGRMNEWFENDPKAKQTERVPLGITI